MGDLTDMAQGGRVVVAFPSPPARLGNARRVGYPRRVGFRPARAGGIIGIAEVDSRYSPDFQAVPETASSQLLPCTFPLVPQSQGGSKWPGARRSPRPPGRFRILLPYGLRISEPGKRKGGWTSAPAKWRIINCKLDSQRSYQPAVCMDLRCKGGERPNCAAGGHSERFYHSLEADRARTGSSLELGAMASYDPLVAIIGYAGCRALPWPSNDRCASGNVGLDDLCGVRRRRFAFPNRPERVRQRDCARTWASPA